MLVPVFFRRPHVHSEGNDTQNNLKTKTRKFLFGNSIAGKIVRFYVLFILIVAVLLYLPFSLQEPTYLKTQLTSTGEIKKSSYTFFDAIFMSVTSFTDTGVVNLNVAKTYSTFGKWVILIAIQLGGLGFVSVIVLIWRLVRSKHTSDLDASVTLFNERGGGKIGNTYRTIVVSIIWIGVVELIFAIIYSFWFYYYPAYQVNYLGTSRGTYYYDSDRLVAAYHHAGRAIFWGVFHSISATNNAGISIIGAGSLAPYRNDGGIFLQVCFIMQIIFGGIGYPLIYDISEHITFKIKHREHHLSLLTKIGLLSYGVVTLFGAVFLFAFEYSIKESFVNYLSDPNNLKGIKNFSFSTPVALNKIYGNNVGLNKFFAILFELFSTRSAGFSTFDNNLLSRSGLWTVTILMFIGANPASTGGGIRSITFIIMVLAVYRRFRTNKRVNIFHRQISEQTISLSYMGTFTIFVLTTVFAMIGFACCGNNKTDVFDFFFVCISAFGTVGLNTLDFSGSSGGETVFLIFLIVLMVIGQLGVSTALFSSTKLENELTAFSYPIEDVRS